MYIYVCACALILMVSFLFDKPGFDSLDWRRWAYVCKSRGCDEVDWRYWCAWDDCGQVQFFSEYFYFFRMSTGFGYVNIYIKFKCNTKNRASMWICIDVYNFYLLLLIFNTYIIIILINNDCSITEWFSYTLVCFWFHWYIYFYSSG